MAYIEPNSEVRFLHDVPLDPDYENTLYFDSIEQQTSYFLGKSSRALTFEKLTYTRKSKGIFRLGLDNNNPFSPVVSLLFKSSYMMFKNTNFENKWFYAFVDKIEYVNNNTVDVEFHIDVMQTWHFDYELNQCLIDRQHTTTDVAGQNTVPEELEHGEYITDNTAYTDIDDDTTWVGPHYRYTPGIMLVVTFDNNLDYVRGKVVEGWGTRGDYFTGVNTLIYSLSTQDISNLNDTLEIIYENAKADGTLALVMVPASLLNADGTSKAAKTIAFSRQNSFAERNPSAQTGYSYYTPRNKKLLCYPYNFLYVSNNIGNAMECRWEDFGNPASARFKIWANYSSSPGLVCIPADYKGMYTTNDDEKITISGFPLCSWTYDSFRAWLAQNTGNIIGGLIGEGLKSVQSIVRNPVNAVGVLGNAIEAVGQLYDHSRVPPQAKGETNGNIVYQSSLMTFSFYNKHIKAEYARIIDDFFDMYGYRIHRHAVPNRNARPCYTYVKTIGCSIHGNVPSDDAITIQNIFNTGCRFWRQTAVFGNYDPAVNNNSV